LYNKLAIPAPIQFHGYTGPAGRNISIRARFGFIPAVLRNYQLTTYVFSALRRMAVGWPGAVYYSITASVSVQNPAFFSPNKSHPSSIARVRRGGAQEALSITRT